MRNCSVGFYFSGGKLFGATCLKNDGDGRHVPCAHVCDGDGDDDEISADGKNTGGHRMHQGHVAESHSALGTFLVPCGVARVKSGRGEQACLHAC